MKRILMMFVSLVFIICLISCNDDEVNETLEITETNITLYENESYTFNLDVSVIVSTDNSEVLSVSGNTIKALKEGIAVATVTLESNEDIYKEVKVTVIRKISELDRLESSITIEEGETYKFDIIEPIVLIASDSTILLTKGKSVAALKEGTAVVTIKLTSDEAISKDINVTVIKKISVLEKIETNITIIEDEEYTFEFDDITLHSSDNNIVSVDGKSIKGVKEGIATVKVRDYFGNYKDITVTVMFPTFSFLELLEFNSNYWLSNEEEYDSILEELKNYDFDGEFIENIQSFTVIPEYGEYYLGRKSVRETFLSYFKDVEFEYKKDGIDYSNLGEKRMTFHVWGYERYGIGYFSVYDDGFVSISLYFNEKGTYSFLGKINGSISIDDILRYVKENTDYLSSTVYLKVGETYTREVDSDIYIICEDNDLIKVEGNTITALKEGKINVTVDYIGEDFQMDTTIYIEPAPELLDKLPFSIVLSEDEEYIFEVEGITLQSIDETIVSVNDNIIKAEKDGTTILKITDELGNCKDVYVTVNLPTFSFLEILEFTAQYEYYNAGPGHDLIYELKNYEFNNENYSENIDFYWVELENTFTKYNLCRMSIREGFLSFFKDAKFEYVEETSYIENKTQKISFIVSVFDSMKQGFTVYEDGTILLQCTFKEIDSYTFNKFSFVGKIDESITVDEMVRYVRENRDYLFVSKYLKVGESYTVEADSEIYIICEDNDLIKVEGNTITALKEGKINVTVDYIGEDFQMIINLYIESIDQ